jgi:glycosyltransferase involved in cell wall biosynthesis
MISGEAAGIITQAKCGMVCEAGDANSLAVNALKFARMSDNERKEMGQNGYKYYISFFSKEIALKTLLNLIKENSVN